MIPNVFVSSTISDLQYLRDTVREIVEDLSYSVTMSEFGDIGYLTDDTVDNSCLRAIDNCQLAVLIIGKRYGNIGKNGLSITHNEFRKIKELNIPVIILINKEVLSYKSLYDKNTDKNDITYPLMENPIEIFKFIDEIKNYPKNNGYIPFDSTESVRNNLKKQFAHLFGRLLQEQYSKIEEKMVDVLAEIKTLRFELLKGREYIPYLKTFNKMLQNSDKIFLNIIEIIYSTLEDAVDDIIKQRNFSDFINNKAWKIIVDDTMSQSLKSDNKNLILFAAIGLFDKNEIFDNGFVIEMDNTYIIKLFETNEIYVNTIGKKYLNAEFDKLK